MTPAWCNFAPLRTTWAISETKRGIIFSLSSERTIDAGGGPSSQCTGIGNGGAIMSSGPSTACHV